MPNDNPTADPRPYLEPSERRERALATGVAVLGVVVLVFALSGAWRTFAPARGPGALYVVAAPTPVSGAAGVPAGAGAFVAHPSPLEQAADRARFAQPGQTHVSARWEAGFYPLYVTAARTFGLNWLLLASVHQQETAFSTAPSTYHGLNFAGCCGGPMQFNVTNGPVSTWALVRDSYRFASRPTGYNHPTARHPSIYDDFDAIMAAARLLASDGAGTALDGSAWQAAYDYYGHDVTGVTYADQVLSRAISWSQRGFCINCALDPTMVAAVDAAYGSPALLGLSPPPALPARPAPPSRRPRSR